MTTSRRVSGEPALPAVNLMGAREGNTTVNARSALSSGSQSGDTTRAPSRLYERLAELREEFRAESVLTMTVSAPPVVTQINQDGTISVNEEPAAMVGMTLSGSMVRLLGHPEGYGLRFAVRRGLYSWERYCASRHNRWPDHTDCPLCAELLIRVIRDGYSVRFLAQQHGISQPRAERMLARGLEHVDKQRERWETQSVA